ncbi:MAG TPA: NAD(P)/FAD-dependent oxidoreductase [Gemmatimonadaceae bacterium]|jgi:thioredoxin reductase|nr:NAD(P)/FAD-dependent oxidoreductase [Gemmatimonadaceae bacterium]
MTETEGLYDVMVIGGSFAGLAAAMQLGRARRRVLVVDAGQPRNRFAPAAHGFLGQDGRTPAQIRTTFRGEVVEYRTVDLYKGLALDARACGDGTFHVEASADGTRALRARRLILATGVVDELPDIPGLAERWGQTVLHCPYCHGYEMANGRLGVLATSEMSMHHALLLPDWSSDVTLFTNGAFSPNAEQRSALSARGVRVETRKVAALTGRTWQLDGVRLVDGEVVPLHALFTAPRTRLASPIAERLGCEIEEGPQGPMIRTDARKATSVNGVFAAGDAAHSPHSITFAVADGAMAGIAAHQSLVMG